MNNIFRIWNKETREFWGKESYPYRGIAECDYEITMSIDSFDEQTVHEIVEYVLVEKEDYDKLKAYKGVVSALMDTDLTFETEASR